MIDIPFFYRYTDKKGNPCTALLIKRYDTSCGYYELINPKTNKKWEGGK